MVKSPAAHRSRTALLGSAAVARTGSSAIRDLLRLTERPDVISLAGGLPDPGSFPVDDLARATAAVLAEDPAAALQYGPTEGYGPLRSWVADRLGAADGPDGVLITTGSQQALDLLGRALVDPGDTVALADPAYVGALQAFRAAGAELAAIPSDRDGLRVDLLEARLRAGLRPRFAYVVAAFDNPTGATLSPARRRALAELAEAFDFWIIDDDPYGDLRWRGAAPDALRTCSDRTLTLGTTSKVLSPGLRVGWLAGPAELCRSVARLKQAADLHTGSLTQRLAHRLLADPAFLPAHLDRLRATYRTRADALVRSMRDHLGDGVDLTAPEGGMFTWARVRGADGRPVDADALLPIAIDAGTAFVPGSAFAVDRPEPGALRLSFATNGPAALDDAAARLARAVAMVA